MFPDYEGGWTVRLDVAVKLCGMSLLMVFIGIGLLVG
jgi:hypothetical protein